MQRSAFNEAPARRPRSTAQQVSGYLADSGVGGRPLSILPARTPSRKTASLATPQMRPISRMQRTPVKKDDLFDHRAAGTAVES
jgi:hypothetical protein